MKMLSITAKSGDDKSDDKSSVFRTRKLDLLVVMAIILSLVYRQINSLTEVVRILNLRGLMWTKAIKVSKQAVSKRLQTIPAQLIADIFSKAVESMQNNQNLSDVVSEKYKTVTKSFSAIWIADASTLEALKRKLNIFQNKKQILAGKIMMIVQMFSHHPIKLWYSQNSRDNEKNGLNN